MSGARADEEYILVRRSDLEKIKAGLEKLKEDIRRLRGERRDA